MQDNRIFFESPHLDAIINVAGNNFNDPVLCWIKHQFHFWMIRSILSNRIELTIPRLIDIYAIVNCDIIIIIQKSILPRGSVNQMDFISIQHNNNVRVDDRNKSFCPVTTLRETLALQEMVKRLHRYHNYNLCRVPPLKSCLGFLHCQVQLP